jgi:hypothetical protein
MARATTASRLAGMSRRKSEGGGGSTLVIWYIML